MTQREFMNRLRGLYNIDADLLPELSEDDWPKFRDNPPRFLMGASDAQADAIWREAERRQRAGLHAEAKFEKQETGAVVATILETDDSIVEVQERHGSVYGLIVYTRRGDGDKWDDLTAYLRPEHFDALGSVARRMRDEGR